MASELALRLKRYRISFAALQSWLNIEVAKRYPELSKLSCWYFFRILDRNIDTRACYV
jgi:hypothetical protein